MTYMNDRTIGESTSISIVEGHGSRRDGNHSNIFCVSWRAGGANPRKYGERRVAPVGAEVRDSTCIYIYIYIHVLLRS